MQSLVRPVIVHLAIGEYGEHAVSGSYLRLRKSSTILPVDVIINNDKTLPMYAGRAVKFRDGDGFQKIAINNTTGVIVDLEFDVAESAEVTDDSLTVLNNVNCDIVASTQLDDILAMNTTIKADSALILAKNTVIETDAAAILAELQGIATAGAFGRVTVGVAAVSIKAANASRKGIDVQADPANTDFIYLGFADTVTTAIWFAKLAPGQGWSRDNYRGDVFAISGTAAQYAGYGEV